MLACQEDPGVGLAAELAGLSAGHASSGSSGGMPAWLAAAIAVPAAVLAAASAAFLMHRHRRRRQRAAAAAGGAKGGDETAPLTPRGSKMGRMESGELRDKPSSPDIVAAATAAGGGGASDARQLPHQQQLPGSRGVFGQDSAGSTHSRGSTGGPITPAHGGGSMGPMTPEQLLAAAGDRLWRARQAPCPASLCVLLLLARQEAKPCTHHS